MNALKQVCPKKQLKITIMLYEMTEVYSNSQRPTTTRVKRFIHLKFSFLPTNQLKTLKSCPVAFKGLYVPIIRVLFKAVKFGPFNLYALRTIYHLAVCEMFF